MASIPYSKITTLKKLYASGMSAQDVANEMKYPLNAVYYAMRKHKIARRTPAANSRLLFDKKAASYSVKRDLSPREKKLRDIGVTLYWAEGYKTNKSPGIDFANSDPAMQQIFIEFLRVICGIDESKIRIQLYCHDREKSREIILFWSTKLDVPASQFTKPFIPKKTGLEKKDKMPYGLVHIRYYDKKLLKQILEWIEDIRSEMRVGGSVDEK